MIIKFKNWDKFQIPNGKKRIERPSWFRLENSITEHELWEKLTPEEFKFYIYMLCFSSKNGNRGSIHDSYRLHSRLSGIEEKVAIHAIKKLHELQVVETRDQDGTWTRPGQGMDKTMLTEQNKTEQNKTEHIMADSATAESRRVFDFEFLYKKYPRKEGKSEGFKRCKAQIKTQEDFDLLSKAIDAYIKHCGKNKIEPKYIKHFSSFMNNWKDWIEPRTGTVDKINQPLLAMHRPLSNLGYLDDDTEGIVTPENVGKILDDVLGLPHVESQD